MSFVSESDPLMMSRSNEVVQANVIGRRTIFASVACLMVLVVAFQHSSSVQPPHITAAAAALLSSSKKHQKKLPTDQIQTFLEDWKLGRCDDLASLVDRRHFEFRVTAFGEDQAEDDDDKEIVLDVDEFVDALCLPYQGHFDILFEENHHSNLGSSFGTIRATGSDYYIKDTVPCLAPYYSSFVVSLDSHGRIQVLRELIHNLDSYNRYTQECLNRGFSLDDDEPGSPKYRLLSKTAKREKKAEEPPTSNLERAKKFIDLYCTGYCDEAGEYLSDSFTMQESHSQPTPLLDRTAYLEMCRHDFVTEPEIFLTLAEVTDGSTVTLTGQGFQMIGGGAKPCPIFATESFFMKFTADGKMDHLFVALQDTYFDDYAACLQ
ncbi:expressed unknown protein [Seminavis robusta]|uniref:NTF2 domain-containing protein n=1 Tax=Seminavis robusta TaxID=568900 RepID=A0A9N8DV68_9STRA|nr:expressed unknown protein [Seminavis robusta]|eukprot:Sro385_g131700.1 n/a (377) ;mRNA; f:47691-48821